MPHPIRQQDKCRGGIKRAPQIVLQQPLALDADLEGPGSCKMVTHNCSSYCKLNAHTWRAVKKMTVGGALQAQGPPVEAGEEVHAYCGNGRHEYHAPRIVGDELAL